MACPHWLGMPVPQVNLPFPASGNHLSGRRLGLCSKDFTPGGVEQQSLMRKQCGAGGVRSTCVYKYIVATLLGH